MNILVTGSNGFVGSKLMWSLEADGHKVIGIDISTHCDAKPHPETILGDIRIPQNLDLVRLAFQAKHNSPIQLIIHCAASKHDFGISRAEYFSHNKYGTRTLLNFADKHNITKLIYISTVGVFGHPQGVADEDNPYAADNPYGESKLAGELLCRGWQHRNESRELIVLRPAVIYGPHNYANMFKLLNMLHKFPYLTVGKGDYVKSIVSLSTVIDMIRFAIDNLKPGYEHYNCVDEPYLTMRKLMELIASNEGFAMPRVKLPITAAIGIGKVFDLPAKILSIDLPVNSNRMRKLATATFFVSHKIRSAGFVQKHSTAQSIAEFCTWYMKLQTSNKH